VNNEVIQFKVKIVTLKIKDTKIDFLGYFNKKHDKHDKQGDVCLMCCLHFCMYLSNIHKLYLINMSFPKICLCIRTKYAMNNLLKILGEINSIINYKLINSRKYNCYTVGYF